MSETKIKKEEQKQEEKPDIKWGENKKRQLGLVHQMEPLLNNLVLILEEERKRTLQQLENAKKLLEKMKST